MKNGYALPEHPAALAALAARLREDPDLAARAEGALRVGVHWATQAKPPHSHLVAQVYASALPVAYSKTRAADWEPFARLVLRGAYEATLAVGALKALEAGTRISVYLTALGGGAFGNRHEWIRDAVCGALETFRDAPLDVFLVHYGTRVPEEWAALRGPRKRRSAPEGAAAAVTAVGGNKNTTAGPVAAAPNRSEPEAERDTHDTL